VLAEKPLLALAGISKRFGATNALEDVSFSLSGGEICGLVGHNGAGKSTLIKIVAGAYTPDSGSISVGGEAMQFATPADAYRAGIRVIHQDAPLVPSFDTIDNCFLGRPYPKALGMIDRKAMRETVATDAREIAPDLPLDRPVAFLTAAQKQFVRLLKAVSDAGKLLILDEPTAALPAEDAEHFFTILNRIRARGTGIVLVSHRLDEIAGFCDRAVVLRDGKTVAGLAGANLTVHNLITEMGGQSGPGTLHQSAANADSPEVLKIAGLTTRGLDAPISLSARSGEIIALYGLSGSGRSSLLNALWGAEKILSGAVTLTGAPYRPASPKHAVAAGVSYVPADRHRTGLFAGLNLVINKTLPLLSSYRSASALPVPDTKAERSAFLVAAERVSMAFRAPEQLAGTLSGGNQQKLIFSRWANRHSKLMLLDEPTEGVDVMAKNTIKQIIRAIAADGNTVLVSTSDREEALELGDRVLVFRDGAIVAEFSRAEATPAALSAAAQAKQAKAS
jgi:ABC-type sugar transport system ATPase subunit